MVTDRTQRLEEAGRLAARNGLAVAWTVGNSGAEAKIVRTHWKEVPPLKDQEYAAGVFANRGQNSNPVAVLRASNVVGVECDSAEDLDVFDAFNLPHTLTIQSSAPERLHFYFRRPEGTPYTHSGFRIEKGNVTGVSGNYFVFAGAVHPTGCEYEVVDDVPIAELSAIQYAALKTAASNTTEQEQRELQADPDAKIDEGRRRDTIFRLACMMRSRGVPKEGILQACLSFNQTRCLPPLSDEQVRVQVDGIERYADGDRPLAPSVYVEPYDTAPLERMSDVLKRALDEPEVVGLPLPLGVGSLVGGRLYVIGGYSGDGKTSYALQATGELASQGKRVLYATLEMTTKDTAKRAAQIHTAQSWANVDHTAFDQWDAFFTTDPAIDRYLEQGAYDLVVFDHIHRADYAERTELERMVRKFKSLALKHEVPIMLLAQLRTTWSHGQAKYPRPTANDLRETRVLEHEADMILFVWRERDDYNMPTQDGELIVAKDRFGEPSRHLVRFDAPWTRWTIRSASSLAYTLSEEHDLLADHDIPF